MDSKRKKAFFEQWFADRLKSQQGTNKMKTTRSVVSETEKKKYFSWMSKERAERELGPSKAKSKIESGKLKTRPDPDTGLSGENDLEYKFWFDLGGETEVDRRQKGIENDQDLDTAEKIAEAKAHFDSIADASASGSAGSGTSAPAKTEAKKEFGDFTKTVEGFKKDPKSTCRNCATVLTELKRIFTQTKDNKYAVAVHEDAKSLIPKAKRVFTILEGLHSNECKDDAAILAMAQLLDPCFAKFNEINEWFCKLNNEKPAKKLKVA